VWVGDVRLIDKDEMLRLFWKPIKDSLSHFAMEDTGDPWIARFLSAQPQLTKRHPCAYGCVDASPWDSIASLDASPKKNFDHASEKQ
jgi:hypothetical protein